jgi:broad specificity phosphatase PhoE
MTAWSTRLYLVRHGETVWNAQRRIQGRAESPLTTRGHRQANAVATALGARSVVAVYCSALRRAYDTAAYIGAAHEVLPRITAALRETDLGMWQGQIPDEMPAEERTPYRAWHQDPAATRPPGGETLTEVLHRVRPAVDGILAAHRGQTIVLVTHSIAGRVALCHLLGACVEMVPRFKLKMASISLVRVDQDGAVLERLGDVSHLAALNYPETLGTPHAPTRGVLHGNNTKPASKGDFS